MLELLKAFVMGIVEGITEFLPISSTGHLIIVRNLLGFYAGRPEAAAAFEVFIQFGALLAVVVVYWQRFLGLITKFNSKKGFEGINGIKLLVIVSLPAAIVGFLLRDVIKQYLFQPLTVAIALLVGGVVLIFIEKLLPKPKISGLDSLTWREALIVGLFQCLSLWPGMSRAASTIVGGMVAGIDRKTAAEFSFFAAVPVMFGATAYDMLKSFKALSSDDILIFAVGSVSSFIFALLAVRTFIRFVSKSSFAPFGWYRVALAGLVFLLIALNVLTVL